MKMNHIFDDQLVYLARLFCYDVTILQTFFTELRVSTGGPRYSMTFYPLFCLFAAQYSTFLREPIPLFMYYHWT